MCNANPTSRFSFSELSWYYSCTITAVVVHLFLVLRFQFPRCFYYHSYTGTFLSCTLFSVSFAITMVLDSTCRQLCILAPNRRPCLWLYLCFGFCIIRPLLRWAWQAIRLLRRTSFELALASRSRARHRQCFVPFNLDSSFRHLFRI